MALKNSGKATGVKSLLASKSAVMAQGDNALVTSEKVRDVNYQLSMLDGALDALDEALVELFDRLMPVIVKTESLDTCKGQGALAQHISPVGCRIKDCREIIEHMACDVRQTTEELQI